ncbi:alpha/beta fold hydrolase [Polaromonas jejuensis]|uniref:Alpha/beta fold hydrolase n=1 Tax=Polaromonas jejuensis TaxID=457502 RepID=A0ABW0Q622_9BURK|nr:alpha/beta hydrolase [Polaromonas jejuensis]
MTQPSLNHVNCLDAAGGHRMAYWQWGQPESSHVVVCVHGLSRQGRDFDVLAQALCEQAGMSAQGPGGIRVICPDIAGRGESDWLKDPMGYQVPAYVADILALLAQLHAASPITTLDWVGTSMGGLIGMAVCGQPGLPLPVPVRRLVLNDVGPAIEWQAILRIGAYLGESGNFNTVQEAADAMWTVSQGFGPHTPEQWLALSRPMLKPVSQAAGSPLRLHYDPAIAVPFKLATEASAREGEAMLWQLYDNITARTLLIRGALSDLLSPETARAMTGRGPHARLIEFEGIGHVPTLIAKDQVAAVTEFLLA